MDVVRHDDESVEEVSAFAAIVLQSFKEEFGVSVDSEDGSSVGDYRGHEKCAGVNWSG
jgi:hypothetical protein